MVTQGYRNITVLYDIREMLGYGAIKKQGPRTFRYEVQDELGLEKMIELLNGNLILEKRITGEVGLVRFIEAYNKRYSKAIVPITTKKQLTQEDGWLSGFVDGDGCFNIGYVSTKKTFPIRFIISQKDSLEHIREVTGGSIEKSKGLSSIVLKDLPGSEGKNTG